MPNSENVSSPANSFKVNTNRATLKFHSGGDRSDGTRNLSGFQITYQGKRGYTLVLKTLCQ